MKRFFGLGVVFLMGMLIGVALIRTSYSRPIPDREAKQRVLAVLDSPPHSSGMADSRIVEAVKKIEPVVVNIDTISRTVPESSETDPLGLGREVRGKGSGVILSADGYIVTNRHVIEEANRIRVTLPTGQWHYARLIGHDPQTDLAVIRIEAANLPYAEIGDSEQLQVGEWAVAVGNPLGLGSGDLGTESAQSANRRGASA
jgi:serine protease Do